MINLHLGNDTPSQKSNHFWEVQIGYWALYTLLGLISGWVLISVNIVPSSLAVLFFELILFKSAFGFLITSSLRPLFMRIHSKRFHPTMMFITLFPAPFLLASGDFLLITRTPILNGHFHALSVLQLMGIHFMTLGLFINVFIFTVWCICYFAASLFLDSIELQRRQKLSDAKLLDYQMAPHFLFNALTATLSVSGNQEKVERLTHHLSDYLHFTLRPREGDYSALGEELEAMENYLQVEKIRFEENLEYSIDADQEAKNLQVERQLVQPLLENAIKYGHQTSPMPLKIRIKAEINSGLLRLTVENSGSWVEAPPTSGKSLGIGLENLRRRLHLVYGNRATLTHESLSDVVRAVVTLPPLSS